MIYLIRIILIITITGLTACSNKEDIVVDKKVQEPDLIQASALNVQLALGYIEREQLGIAQEKLDKEYNDLMADPVAATSAVLDWAGQRADDGMGERIEAFLAGQRAGARPPPRQSLPRCPPCRAGCDRASAPAALR